MITLPAAQPPAADSGGPLVYTVVEAARVLGISRAHAYGLARSGELPNVRLGRRILVPAAAVEQLLTTPLVEGASRT